MIHQYKLNNYNIVVDANSASVHSVDEVAYDMIEIIDSCINIKRKDVLNSNGRIIHVGIYLGDGKIVHASGEVRIDTLTPLGIVNHDTQELTHTLHSIRRMGV